MVVAWPKSGSGGLGDRVGVFSGLFVAPVFVTRKLRKVEAMHDTDGRVRQTSVLAA